MAWKNGKPDGIEVGGVMVEASLGCDATVYVCSVSGGTHGQWLTPDNARRLAAELTRFAAAADGDDDASATVHLTPAQVRRIMASGWVAGEMALEEWLTKRAEEAHTAGQERVSSEVLDLLLEAAQVPEHADPVEWMKAMREVITCAAALSQAQNEAGPATTQAWFDRLHDALKDMSTLRTPPRPLPTEPGWWWGRVRDDSKWTPVLVDYAAIGSVHGPGGLSLSGWTWLTRDGACVRCEPPGGGE